MGTASGTFSRFLRSYNDQISADSVDDSPEGSFDEVDDTLQAVAEAMKTGRGLEIASLRRSGSGRRKAPLFVEIDGELIEIKTYGPARVEEIAQKGRAKGSKTVGKSKTSKAATSKRAPVRKTPRPSASD